MPLRRRNLSLVFWLGHKSRYHRRDEINAKFVGLVSSWNVKWNALAVQSIFDQLNIRHFSKNERSSMVFNYRNMDYLQLNNRYAVFKHDFHQARRGCVFKCAFRLADRVKAASKTRQTKGLCEFACGTSNWTTGWRLPAKYLRRERSITRMRPSAIPRIECAYALLVLAYALGADVRVFARMDFHVPAHVVCCSEGLLAVRTTPSVIERIELSMI